MSLMSKRDRLYKDYDLIDLPPRNEGKIKTFNSCTDARAWSHLGSNKTEHLVDIIKRNNEICRPKYIPTDVIVNTLTGAKNSEIARLKRKIGEFEQMIAAYELLDLTNDQKCEIASAHAAIRAAQKELDDLSLDLDLTGFTEGIDSEGFETGKSGGDMSEMSRGDEWSYHEKSNVKKTQTKSSQIGTSITSDVSTYISDSRIDEMQETIIIKDAKLNAMQNTIAVMENDLCEPYCIYAHIYTAIEKIFGILCQNTEYKRYLELLTVGKQDVGCIDIKGRILFKLKVLEKFCIALIAPCTQSMPCPINCACYRAEIEARVETSYTLTTELTLPKNLDNKRAHLIADIMDNEEMKELLTKDCIKTEEQADVEMFYIDNYDIETENLSRLKNLQVNYEELVICYENIKQERDCLMLRCKNYNTLESEVENLQLMLKEYNNVWNEKEHFKKRSDGLNSLREQYMVLTDETLSLEGQLKAESEINSMKATKITELTHENINLEKRINDITITFEKEKNAFQCKLKETECKMMCQEQQIKSMSLQIDRLLEHDNEGQNTDPVLLLNEIGALKEEINNMKDLLFCNEEEKQHLQEQFESKLDIINDLKMQIEEWKSNYKQIMERNEYLENFMEDSTVKLNRLVEVNESLSHDINEKSTAVENLINIIKNKSEESNKVREEFEIFRNENDKLREQLYELHAIQNVYNCDIKSLEGEKQEALNSLKLVKRESEELIKKVKDFDELVDKNQELLSQNHGYEELKIIHNRTIEENKILQDDLENQRKSNTMLLQEINRLNALNISTTKSINSLEIEKCKYINQLEETKTQTIVLESKLSEHESVAYNLKQLQENYKNLDVEKQRLEKELRERSLELHSTMNSLNISRRESEELLQTLQNTQYLKDDLSQMTEIRQKIINEKYMLEKELANLNLELQYLTKSHNALKTENEDYLKQNAHLQQEIETIKLAYEEIFGENSVLQNNLENKIYEIENLYKSLENHIEENRELKIKLNTIESDQLVVKENLTTLEREKLTTKSSITAINKECHELKKQLNNYHDLEKQLSKLQCDYEHIIKQKEDMKKAYESDLKELKTENKKLNDQYKDLISHSEILENAIINTRNELVLKNEMNGGDESLITIFKEVQSIKNENIMKQNKIRDLLDKADEYDNVICNLSQEISARDDKISILENHINNLQDEVKRLHDNFVALIDTSEQIKDNSFEEIKESLKIMETNHSRATHSMKMEIEKLQNMNTVLEKELSFNKIKSHESLQEKNKYISQLIQLQNEKDLILQQLQFLETKGLGDSALSAGNCCVEDILFSFDRIRKTLDTSNTKSCCLEKRLLNVQTSSQLLLSKADEAKKIVEKEKQKINIEKEEAVRDRFKMENDFKGLKEQLDTQILHDKTIIKDLEAELSNQKLIIDNLKKSTKDHITRLSDDLNNLHISYKEAMAKNKELEKKVENLSFEGRNHIEVIEKTNALLNEKSEEVKQLINQLNVIKTKDMNRSSVETETTRVCVVSRSTQHEVNQNMKEKDLISLENTFHALREQSDKCNTAMDEIQVMTAQTEPSFDFVRNSYFRYKISQLSLGPLNQYSITDEEESNYNNTINSRKSIKMRRSKDSMQLNMANVTNRSKYINFSNEIEYDNTNEYDDIMFKSEQSSPIKSSPLMENDLSYFTFSNNSFRSPEGLKDKDMHLLYKDSKSTFEQFNTENSPECFLQLSENSGVFVKKVSNRHKEITSQSNHVMNANNIVPFSDDSSYRPPSPAKLKLDILLPNLNINTLSQTNSNLEKSSLSSYALQIYLSPKRISRSDENINSNSNTGVKIQQNTSLPAFSDDHVANQTNSEMSRKKRKSNIQLQEAFTVGLEKSKVTRFKSSKNKQYTIHYSPSISLNDNLLQLNKHIRNEDTTPERISPDSTCRDDNFQSRFDNLKVISNNNRYSCPENIDKKNIFASIIKNQPNMSPTKQNALYTVRESPSQSSSDKVLRRANKSVLVKIENTTNEYEDRIKNLTDNLQLVEKECKRKIAAIKLQYDNSIKTIINEHNQGVRSLQSLHEETLQDIIKTHENEVDNLRSLSIEAMMKADKYDKENKVLKYKLHENTKDSDQEPVKISARCTKKRKVKPPVDMKNLTKTNVQAISVQAKPTNMGPCTCTVDVTLSDTIRNIFDQVDVRQRKTAENNYVKYIANKLTRDNIDALDAQELSFLHLKVCRTWKTKLSKEEALQKKIISLETEVMNKQRDTHQHFATWDRMVEEEKRRLQVARDAVCQGTGHNADNLDLSSLLNIASSIKPRSSPTRVADRKSNLNCPDHYIGERRSAGDLIATLPVTHSPATIRPRRLKQEFSNRAVLAKFESDGRKHKPTYHDDPPTKLKRGGDRATRGHKKYT